MGHIYGNAQRVLIWLGGEKDGSRIAMRTLRLRGDMYASLSNHSHVQRMLRDPQIVAELFDPDAWTAIDYLLERPWWRRI